MNIRLLSARSLEGGVSCLGDTELLNLPLTAFFASRRSPGVAIRAAMEWSVAQACGINPVISPFAQDRAVQAVAGACRVRAAGGDRKPGVGSQADAGAV